MKQLADALVRVATHPMGRTEELLPERWAAATADKVAETALVWLGGTAFAGVVVTGAGLRPTPTLDASRPWQAAGPGQV